MRDPAPSTPPGLLNAWVTVFLSTLVSGVLAVWSLVLVTSVARGSTTFIMAGQSFIEALMGSALLGASVAAPVGAVSATICAPLLRNRPRKAVFWGIVLVSLIVGPLSSPFVHIFSAGLVLLGQVMTSIAIFSTEKPGSLTQVDLNVCASCRYSLVGLDRATTSVCPECGEAIPVRP